MKQNADSACELCHGSGFVNVPPSEEHPYGTFTECACQVRLRRRRRLEKLMAAAGITLEQLQAWSFDTFDPQAALADAAGKKEMAAIKAACQAYAAQPKGWLVLCGPYGCGKTHLAYAIIGAAYRSGVPVYACSVPDLLETLRQGIDSQARGDTLGSRLETVRTARLLLLDDLGAENLTPWAAEKLYQIVDYRHRSRLPLVVTTNVNVFDAKGRIEPRVLSRLLDGTNLPDGLSRVYLLSARDYRQRRQ
jgi:DNA replication protein DnaC